ncbi:hypothetical protein BHM03_00005320 [Ensete ventricosum]|nr:hypothetical protein BHM03_00005320 [Ensete ventricosum]
MLQRANQYVAVETLVAEKREDQKRPQGEPSRGPPFGPSRRRMEKVNRPCPGRPIRYYRFHHDYGHDTEECYDLKNQIDDLIHRGHLDQYIMKPREPSLRPKGPVERHIDIIVFGPTAGFTGDAITPVGIATLPMTFDDEPRTKTLMVHFMVVDLPSAYNVIIGRSTLNKLRAIVSIYHRSMKFPTSTGPGEIKSDPQESRRCSLATTTIPRKGKKAPVPDPCEPHRPDTRPEAFEPILEVPLEKAHPERTVRILNNPGHRLLKRDIEITG